MRDAQAILAALAGPERAPIAGRVLIVLAHPDDETLACSTLLPRLSDGRLVTVTDGAPPDGGDARRLGFASPAAYAEVRHAELRAALAVAGFAEERRLTLDVPDQGVAASLAALVGRLLPLVAEAECVVTHTYEGGHPDHDGVCFAVHRAIDLSASRPIRVEVPLYRASASGAWERQSFAEPGRDAMAVRLTPQDRDRKARMLACHRTQRDTLAAFGAADEPFRPAPIHDFRILPNGGDLLYARQGWGLTADGWLAAVAQADHVLSRRAA